MKHLMLDIETLSTRPDAAVFEVAIAEFTLENLSVSPANLRRWMCKPSTGHIDPETVAWWMDDKRATHAKFILSCPVSEATVAAGIQAYLERVKEEHPKIRLWAMPTSFDCVILQSFLQRNGCDLPIDFRQWRDVRTILELAGWPKEPSGLKAHTAAGDCQNQISQLVEAWRRLNPMREAF